jgi:hypothetical protein
VTLSYCAQAYYLLASAIHFFVKLFFAAPNILFSATFASQASFAALADASVSHFLIKLVCAALASFFSTALIAQSVSAAIADWL